MRMLSRSFLSKNVALLSVLLFSLVNLCAFSTSALSADGTTGEELDVTHYKIYFDAATYNESLFDPIQKEGRAPVKVIIELKTLIETESIDLNFEVLEDIVPVESVKVNGSTVPFKQTSSKFLNIILAEKSEVNESFEIQIKYILNTKGIKLSDKSYYTDVLKIEDDRLTFQPYHIGFRGAFPSNDHFFDGATVEFIFKTPPQFTTVAPGRPLEGRQPTHYGKGQLAADGTNYVHHWVLEETSYTAVFSFAVSRVEESHYCHYGKIRSISGNEIPVMLFSPIQEFRSGERCSDTEDTSQLEQDIKIFNLMEEYVGPFPFASAQLGFSKVDKHMEWLTWVGFPNSHETVHYWFGNAIRPSNIGDGWISEGFTRYFDYIGQGLTPKKMPPKTLNGAGLVYNEGASALHELRTRVADVAGLYVGSAKELSVFKAFLHKYYDRFLFNSLDSQLFVDFMHEAYPAVLDEQEIEYSVDELLIELDQWKNRYFNFQ